MISKPLFKQTFKSSYKLLIVFMAVLTMYMSIIVTMYDPNGNDIMQQMMDMKLEGFASAFGFDIPDSTLIGFLSSYFYGFIIIMFPMIFDIIMANKLISKQVDKGSMSNLLSTTNTRNKISVTYMAFMLSSVTFLIAFNTIIGIIVSETNFKGQLDIPKFILLNFGALLLHFAISGICFFASCIFNETKNSLAFGAGIPIAFFLIQMLGNMGGKLEKFKYFTMFTLFNPDSIIEGDASAFISLIVLFVISVALYVGGIYIFNKKDLPL